MKTSKYNGIIPAFYACYDDEGNISAQRTRDFAQHLIEKGVNGLYVGGSSGECIYQSVAERKTVLENVMAKAKGKVTVIAHVACNSTKDSMELAAHAESLGVDAIAAIPPIYFKLPEAAIAKYWNDISNAAPKTDFIIYNIPQLAGVSLTPSLLKEMLKNKNVVGVKNSSMAIQDIQTFQTIGGENFVVFNGPDEQYIGGRAIGACGGIGGTYGLMPQLFIKLEELIKSGEHEKATILQYKINDIISDITSTNASMYAVIKAIINEMYGLEFGGVKAPFINVDKSHAQHIKMCAQKVQSYIDAL